MLRGVVNDLTGAQGGLATRAQIPGWPVGGKTGTTNDVKDLWFAGVTPTVAGAVWVGKQDGGALPGWAYSGEVPTPVWQQAVAGALQGQTPVTFQEPSGITYRTVRQVDMAFREAEADQEPVARDGSGAQGGGFFTRRTPQPDPPPAPADPAEAAAPSPDEDAAAAVVEDTPEPTTAEPGAVDSAPSSDTAAAPADPADPGSTDAGVVDAAPPEALPTDPSPAPADPVVPAETGSAQTSPPDAGDGDMGSGDVGTAEPDAGQGTDTFPFAPADEPPPPDALPPQPEIEIPPAN
jgi:membrane peptidoglycan carboxypeptidase